MLKNCTVQFTEREIEAAAVQALVAETFPDISAACVLWEGIQKSKLLPLSAFSLPEGWQKDCLRLVISSACKELRLERGDKGFMYRLLEETANTGIYRVHEDLLMLRKNYAISSILFNGGRGRIAHREYFRQDEDGMLVFYADRLAGAVIDGKGQIV